MATSVSPSQLQSFLAFDFGLRRIGVASGTRLLGAAEPRGTIKGGDFDAIAGLSRVVEPRGIERTDHNLSHRAGIIDDQDFSAHGFTFGIGGNM